MKEPYIIPPHYVRKYYNIDGKLAARWNPDYSEYHCMTVTKCDKCGEYYEASAPHICWKANSYPAPDESEDE